MTPAVLAVLDFWREELERRRQFAGVGTSRVESLAAAPLAPAAPLVTRSQDGTRQSRAASAGADGQSIALDLADAPADRSV